MKEIFEFRVVEDFAPRLFGPSEGERLGTSVRKVKLLASDPRLEKIRSLQAQINAETGRSFFHGWRISRRYTSSELEQSELFHFHITSTFEPAGEECGTVYDESTACQNCGAGARQVSDLRLDLRKAPRTRDIARTIAGEVVVSQRLAEVLIDNEMKGFKLGRVRHKARFEDDPIELSLVPTGRKILIMAEAAGAPHPSAEFWVWLNRPENRKLNEQVTREYASMKERVYQRKGKPLPVWFQLLQTPAVGIVPPTRTGIEPFDRDEKGEFRCPRGDTIGLNLLSELWLSRSDFEACNCDITFTNQFIGTRRGLLRPEPRLLISPRLWRTLVENEIKGFRVEVAHLK